MTRVYELPYPPSVNHYWRRVGWRMLISREGRRYRREVVALLAAARARPMRGTLVVRVRVHPPDGRRRDLDNLPKALLDALEHGGAFTDDSQIAKLELERADVAPGGKVMVEIEERTLDMAGAASRHGPRSGPRALPGPPCQGRT